MRALISPPEVSSPDSAASSMNQRKPLSVFPSRAGGPLTADRLGIRAAVGAEWSVLQLDACVCASERTQPTGAPLLSSAFSSRRLPASPSHETLENLS